MPRRRPVPACPRCRDIRRAHQLLDERLLIVKARLLARMEELDAGTPPVPRR